MAEFGCFLPMNHSTTFVEVDRSLQRIPSIIKLHLNKNKGGIKLPDMKAAAILFLTFSFFGTQPLAHAALGSDDATLNDFAQDVGIDLDQPITVSVSNTDAPTQTDENRWGWATDEDLKYGIKMIGHPIQDKRTDEILLVACIGRRIQGTQERYCDFLQHVYFANPGATPHLVGPVFEVQTDQLEPSRNEIKTTLREIAKAYHESKWDEQNGPLRLFIGVGASMGVGTLIGMTVALLPGVLIALVPYGAVWGWAALHQSVSPFSSLYKHSTITRLLQDQNGWNWSSSVKRIKHKNFQFYLDIL